MREVLVNLAERSYVITVGVGALDKLGSTVRDRKPTSALVVTNPIVGKHYAQQAMESLAAAEVRAELVTLPSGERFKTLGTVRRIYEALIDMKMDRKGVVVALGGGVIGDMSGFAAATYMRGVNFVQVPTTLLSQVDASVGGKTGVDVPQGKNLIGAFHQPSAVLIDTLTLNTLPVRELRSGLAEIIKHGIIYDQEFYGILHTNASVILKRSDTELTEAILRSVEIKRDIVQMDERESGVRATLNYGHTVGHAIEALSGYGKYRHGEALAVGMLTEAIVSEKLGMAEFGIVETILATLRKYRLPVAFPQGLDTEDILHSIELDKKTLGGKIRLALPPRIGACEVVSDVSRDDLVYAIETHRKMNL